MSMIDMEQKSHIAMVAKGWQYVGVYEGKITSIRLQSQLIAGGCEIRETQFDGTGDVVPNGCFALWVNPCAIADCGCVEHASEGWPCEHDLEKLEELKKKILV